jgi:DNA-binding winged helix-turn-helix (wHTH) protein
VYQALPDPTDTVRVVLVFDVPAGAADLPHRTAQLADDFGALIAETLPGVRVRPAVVEAALAPIPGSAASPVAQGLTVGTSTRTVHVDGRAVHLTYREFELLSYLMNRRGSTVSREELVREVWRDSPPDSAPAGSHRTVDTHVRRLRAKLGPYAGILTTVRGRGYRCDPGSEAGRRLA